MLRLTQVIQTMRSLLAIVRHCHTLLAKYPKNELVREVSGWKFAVACSRCGQNLKFGDFTWSSCRGPQKYLLNSVLHVQHDYLWSFNQWYQCFVALLLPSPLSFLKLPIMTCGTCTLIRNKCTISFNLLPQCNFTRFAFYFRITQSRD